MSEGVAPFRQFHLPLVAASSSESDSGADSVVEQQVAESGLSPETGSGAASVKAILGRTLLIAATVLLAALPPWLVVWDRWLGEPLTSPAVKQLWCKIAFLCDLGLPPYFLLIFACFLGVLVLVWWNKHNPVVLLRESPAATSVGADQGVSLAQSRLGRALLLCSAIGLAIIIFRAASLRRVPGWELAVALLTYLLGWLLLEISLMDMLEAWRQKRDMLLSLLLAHLALVGFLANASSLAGGSWLLPVLLALAVLNLLRHVRQVHPVFWIISLALVLCTLQINAWWFAVAGDEYAFFHVAKRIAERQSLSVIGTKLFHGLEVYGTHPYLSSLIQAVSMKLLGISNFGWRFSSMYLSAISIGLFFLFFRAFAPHDTALLASVLLASSHYLMNFAKIGYNNLQALFAMSLALWATAWALNTRRHLAFAVLGLAIGFCFYVYPAALYVIPIPGLFLLVYAPPRSRRAVVGWAILIVSALLCIFPLFLQPDYWQSKLAGTFLGSLESAQRVGTASGDLASPLLYAFWSFVYAIRESHFVAASHVDPLSAALVIIGMAYLIKLVRTMRPALLLILSFSVLVLLVGASHGELLPPTTRMFLLLPGLAWFAAVGLTWVQQQIRRLLGRDWPMASFTTVVLTAVIGLNLYQAYSLSPRRLERYQDEVTLYLRMAMQAQEQQSEPLPTFVFITDPTWSPQGISDNLHPVYFPASPPELVTVIVTDTTIPQAARALISDPNSVVVIKPWLAEGWKAALEASLRSLGKGPCDIKTRTGRVRFQLWHSGGWTALCG
jgi:hypothetical protein